MPRYTITDEAGDGGTITVEADDVAAALRGWYPDAPAEVHEQVDALAEALQRGDVPANPVVRGEYLEDMLRRTPGGQAAQYLAVRVEPASPLAEAGARWAAAKAAEGEARAALREAVVGAVADGMSESEAARLAGVDRMTVRDWLGKR